MRRVQSLPPFLDFPGPIAFAHRGGNEVAPENTLEAFEAAVGLGYQYLETDVHLTRGGEIVAFHDKTLERVLGGDRTIADLSVAERKAAHMQQGARQYTIPLLDELLEHFPDTRFNIDAKSRDVVMPLLETLKRHDALDRVCVASFSNRNLRRMRRLVPGICSTLSPSEVAQLWLTSKLPFERVLGAKAPCVELPYKQRLRSGHRLTVATKALIQKAHAHGMQVHVWTINNEAHMHHLLDLGVDGIMTDKPSVLKAVLVARGQWIGV